MRVFVRFHEPAISLGVMTEFVLEEEFIKTVATFETRLSTVHRNRKTYKSQYRELYLKKRELLHKLKEACVFFYSGSKFFFVFFLFI